MQTSSDSGPPESPAVPGWGRGGGRRLKASSEPVTKRGRRRRSAGHAPHSGQPRNPGAKAGPAGMMSRPALQEAAPLSQNVGV